MIVSSLLALMLQASFRVGDIRPPNEYSETMYSQTGNAYVSWYREGINISLYPKGRGDPCARQYCATISISYQEASRGVTVSDYDQCRYWVQVHILDGNRGFRLRTLPGCPVDFSGFYMNPTGERHALEEGQG